MSAQGWAIPLRRRPVAARPELGLLVTASALLVIGLVTNLSASSVPSVSKTGSAFTLFARQFVWGVLGLAALLICSRLDYRKLRGLSYLGVPMVWVLLVATVVVGVEGGGATRWLQFGPLTLQPSELAKLVVILFGADVLSRKMHLVDEWRHVVVPFGAAVGVTCLFVLMQPDFGTTVIIGAAAFLLVFLAGTPLRHIGIGAAAMVLVGMPVMLAESYRRARLFGFFNATDDALNTGWQSIQGLIGLGAGGFFGVGLGASRQKWFFLPNAHTDFIFAILGEETGLAGTLTVLFLFAILAVLGVRAARSARDPFGFLLASGVTGWIALQVLVNIGAVVGVLPITGVPLPLISSGGSSLLFSLAGLGLVASVARTSGAAPGASRGASAGAWPGSPDRRRRARAATTKP